MIVESMSATSSCLKRGPSACTITSAPGRGSRPQRAALRTVEKRRSAASPASIHASKAAPGSRSRSSPRARSINLSSSRPAAISVAMPTHPPLAVIAGPTASGKSALALALAEQTGGVIVNADSAELYRDLRLLSAAPGADDKARAEQRRSGLIEAGTAGRCADQAEMAAHVHAG